MKHSYMFMKHHGMGGMDCCTGMKGHGDMRCGDMDDDDDDCCGSMMKGDTAHMKVKVTIDKDGKEIEKVIEREPEEKSEKK
jgi:hypothetical protein